MYLRIITIFLLSLPLLFSAALLSSANCSQLFYAKPWWMVSCYAVFKKHLHCYAINIFFQFLSPVCRQKMRFCLASLKWFPHFTVTAALRSSPLYSLTPNPFFLYFFVSQPWPGCCYYIYFFLKSDLDLIARGLFHKKILRQHFFSKATCEIPPHLSWLAEPNPKCGHSSTCKCLYPESTHNILILAVHWGTTQPQSKCYLKCSVYRIHFLFCIFLQGWVRVPLSDQKWNHLKMQKDWWKCPDWSFREYVIMIIQQ